MLDIGHGHDHIGPVTGVEHGHNTQVQATVPQSQDLIQGKCRGVEQAVLEVTLGLAGGGQFHHLDQLMIDLLPVTRQNQWVVTHPGVHANR